MKKLIKVLIIVWSLIVLIAISETVSAYEENNTISWGTYSPVTTRRGLNALFNQSVYIRNVTKTPSSTCTVAYIYNYSTLLVSSSALTGQYWTFNGFNLTTDYNQTSFVCDNGGSNYQQADKASFGGEDTGFLNWLHGAIHPGANWGGNSQVYNIVGVGFTLENGTVEASPTPSLTLNTDMSNNTKNNNQESITINFNGTLSNQDNDYFDCFLYDNSSLLDFKYNINISQNQQFTYTYPDSEKDYLFYITCNQDTNVYNVTSYNVTIGTYNLGNLTSLKLFNDSNELSFNEVSGSVGFDVYFNITGVTDFEDVIMQYSYEAGQESNTDLFIYNNTLGNYDQVLESGQQGSYLYLTKSYSDSSDYINSGLVMLRLLHNSTGNPSETYLVDYLTVHDTGLNDTTGIYNYSYDNIIPTISTIFSNGTEYTQNDVLSLNVTFSDSNLLAINITHFDANGLSLQNIFDTNLTITNYENVSTRTLTDTGNFTIKLEAWDSHTLNEIKPYKIDSLINGVEFDDSIKITSDNFKGVKTDKLKDRYSFSFNFANKSTWNTLYLESTGPLTYLKDSPYKLHFIDWENKKWIDFESLSYSQYNIEFLSNNKVQINLRTGDNIKEISFNSIGDLNYASKIYKYSVVEADTSVDLTNIENYLSSISNSIGMIPLILLYIGLMALGYHMIITGNFIAGIVLWIQSLGLDAMLLAQFYNSYSSSIDSTAIGSLISIFMVFMLLSLFTKIGIALVLKGYKLKA